MVITALSSGNAAASVIEWVWPFERDDLAQVLFPGEAVTYMTTGYLLRSARVSVRRWRVIVSSHRLLLVQGGRFTSRRVIQIGMADMLGAGVHRRLLTTEVVLQTRGRTLRIGNVPTADIPHFVDAVNAACAAHPAHPAHSVGTAPTRVRHVIAARADGRLEELEEAVDRLENTVSDLQQQVAFLEQLLAQRASSSPPVG